MNLRARSTEKSNDHIGNRNHDLPACIIVPQATKLQRAALSALHGVKRLISNMPVTF
jgi:hypothetical protein